MPLVLSPTQLAFNARGDGKFNKPFQAQVDFFRQKLNLPTEHYDDIIKSSHDRAFMVAGAMKADLLDDLRKAVDQSIAEGKSIQWFRQQFDEIVRKHGWEGWTGSDTKAGRDWRTRVIYNTNLSASYAAGRWQQLNDPDLLSVRPYWKYVHNDTVRHPREEHVAWSGLVLRHDDPWWHTHFPPNGWGCRCRVVPVRASEFKGDKAPDDGTYIKEDRNGTRHVIPNGIDYGFDYAPGASLIKQPFIDDKLAALPEPLAKALADEVLPLSKPVFIPQKTTKQAAQWAVDNDLVDFADYQGVDVLVANEMNESLFNHLSTFPELRKNQKFIGTGQAQFKKWHDESVQNAVSELVKKGYDQATSLKIAKSYFKIKKMDFNTWMHSWNHPLYSGVAVNRVWGKDINAFKQALTQNVTIQYHPIGCDSIKSVVDHEFAHQLDHLLGLSGLTSVKNLFATAIAQGISASVSNYASSDIAEFIAECWAEFNNNPSPRFFAQQIGDIIYAEYKKAYR